MDFSNSYGSIYYAGPSAGTSMNTGDSIVLADILRDKFSKLEKMGIEIATIERTVGRPAFSSNVQRAWIRYFVPFLVAGVASYIILGAIGIFSGIRDDERLFVYLLFNGANYLLPLLIIGFGAIYATRKRKAARESAQTIADYASQRRVQEIAKCEELRKACANLTMELNQFNELIPERFRNSSSMYKVKTILEDNKAQNFSEAIAELSRMPDGFNKL